MNKMINVYFALIISIVPITWSQSDYQQDAVLTGRRFSEIVVDTYVLRGDVGRGSGKG